MRMTVALLLASLGLSSACVQFRRLWLSEAVVASARPLSRVAGVPRLSSCGELCLREPLCAAIRFRPSLAACHLLTARFDLLEGPGASGDVNGPAEVWAVIGRGFGECPVAYTAAWQFSRYRWERRKVSWAAAAAACEREGGKLAELASREEMQAVYERLGIPDGFNFIHIGAARPPQVKEKAEGWRFRRSGRAVDAALFGPGEPNNAAGIETSLSAYKWHGRVHYNDYPPKLGGEFICECVRLA